MNEVESRRSPKNVMEKLKGSYLASFAREPGQEKRIGAVTTSLWLLQPPPRRVTESPPPRSPRTLATLRRECPTILPPQRAPYVSTPRSKDYICVSGSPHLAEPGFVGREDHPSHEDGCILARPATKLSISKSRM